MIRTAHAILILTSLGVACDDERATAEPDPAHAPAPEAAAAPEAADDPTRANSPEGEPDPCALLTEAVLRATFGIPADTAIQNPASRNPVRPACAYVWDKPNADEIREQITKIQQESAQERKMRRGNQAQAFADVFALPRVQNRVSLNFAPPTDTAEAARTMFDRQMARHQRGITHRVDLDENEEGVTDTVRREVGGQDVTFRADLELVEGFGDEARWLRLFNQLSVLDDTQILHLTVEMNIDHSANRDSAKRLMRALLD